MFLRACAVFVLAMFSSLCVHAVDAAGFSVNHDTGVISWTDGSANTWAYTVSSQDWSWSVTSGSTVLWQYDNDAQTFTNTATGEVWSYDTDTSLWTNEATQEAWSQNTMTGAWSVASLVGEVVTISPATWTYQYDTDVSTFDWKYARSVSDTPVVPTAETWAFTPSTQEWNQSSPDTGASWSFNSLNISGEWRDNTTSNRWEFSQSASGVVQWYIPSYSPSSPYDQNIWSLNLSTGVWQSQLVVFAHPSEDAAAINWQYSTVYDHWYKVGAPSTTQSIIPVFPPTPFAHYQAVINTDVAMLAAGGFLFGSTDGTGAGTINQSTNTIFDDGVFTFGDAANITLLSFNQTVSLCGDIELHAAVDATVIFGDGTTDGQVIFKPLTGAPAAQLIFNVDAGRTLEVQVLNTTRFYGNASIPLYVSFRGAGTTRFRLPSGVTLSFGPAPSTNRHGVILQVLMDLMAADIANGVQQVVFEPWSYAAQDSSDPSSVNTHVDLNTYITLGRSTALRFVSYNVTGTDATTPGYGALAFDVCQAGRGRTILELAAGASPGDGLDAAINIWGNLITGTGTHGAVLASDLRTGVSANKRAGMLAIISIIDDVALNASFDDPTDPSHDEAVAWVARDRTHRRGLVVANCNQTYPYLLSNLSGALSLELSDWAPSQAATGYQPGFILGDNGQIFIRHNLFLDYVAGSANMLVSPTQLAGSGVGTTSTVKFRNPAALITDQIGVYSPSTDSETWDMAYEGTTHASIILEGTAGVFMRSGASAATGTLVALVEAMSASWQALDATIGSGVFDGTYCPVLNVDGSQSAAEAIVTDSYGQPLLTVGDSAACLDGHYALDIEGQLSIISTLGRFGEAPNGYVTIPSIRIDHTGTEIAGT